MIKLVTTNKNYQHEQYLLGERDLLVDSLVDVHHQHDIRTVQMQFYSLSVKGYLVMVRKFSSRAQLRFSVCDLICLIIHKYEPTERRA